MDNTETGITVSASIEWEVVSETKISAVLLIDGAKLLLRIDLEFVSDSMLSEYVKEYPEVEVGWCYTDGECYFNELAVEGSELEKFITSEINSKLNKLNEIS